MTQPSPPPHHPSPGPPRPAHIGLTLFSIYLAAFVAFLLLHVFLPDALGDTEIPLGADRVLTLWGANIAIVCGIGIILLAMFFCLVYLRAIRSSD